MPKRYALTLVAVAILALFIGVWTAILYQTVEAALVGSTATIQQGLTVAGGTVSTLIASLTAASLGFSVADAREKKLQDFLRDNPPQAQTDAQRGRPRIALSRWGFGGQRETGATPSSVGTETAEELTDSAREITKLRPSELTGLTPMTIAAIVTYLAVGIAVLVVWLFYDAIAPEIVGGFALSVVGWLIGSASLVFETRDAASGAEGGVSA